MKSQGNGKNGDPFKKPINVVCKLKVCYFVLISHYQIFVMNCNIFTPLDASFEFLSLSNWVAWVHPKPYLWIFKLTILFTLTQIARGHQSGLRCFALQQLRKCIKDCVHSFLCMLGLVYKLVLSGPGFWVGSEFKQVITLRILLYARSCVLSTRTLRVRVNFNYHM
jgi:hypothetical protein